MKMNNTRTAVLSDQTGRLTVERMAWNMLESNKINDSVYFNKIQVYISKKRVKFFAVFIAFKQVAIVPL